MSLQGSYKFHGITMIRPKKQKEHERCETTQMLNFNTCASDINKPLTVCVSKRNSEA